MESPGRPTPFGVGERLARKSLVPPARSVRFPIPDAGWLVRYRFRTPADLYRHLSAGQGFAVPHPTPPHRVARAIVEVSFTEGESTLLLHGYVRSRSQTGAVVDVPLARPTVRWMADAEGPRRQERRIACDLFVEVRPRGSEPWLCRALDLSAGGLRLAAGAVELGVAGDEMELTLLSPDGRVSPVAARARLAWAGMREAGLQIVLAPQMEAMLHAAEARLASVPTIDHDSACACVQNTQRAS